MSPVFAAAALHYRYPGSQAAAVNDVTLKIESGSFTALIGPNGSGKSTLLKLLVGALRPESGTASYQGRDSVSWDRRELARAVGVVPQLEEMLFPFTVRELVGMGRYPHLGSWQNEREQDRAAIDRALQRCDVSSLADRTLQMLSGGERQRVRIARALAQEPTVLVLDEPTAALDVGHEMALFELLAELRRHDGATILAATHNVNLAARYASSMVLLSEGSAVVSGTPDEVLQRDRIEEVYQWPVLVTRHPGPGPDTGAPQIVTLAGDGTTPT
ncbi:MAG: ABC transporter ATP-binding protein [Gemmatimonadota bacterium]